VAVTFFWVTDVNGTTVTAVDQVKDNTTSRWMVMHLLPLLFRIVLLTCGLWIGETFCPIVLTGSIATGKSTVAQMMTKPQGSSSTSLVYLIDADSIGHEILLPPSVLQKQPQQSQSSSSSSYTVKPTESVYHRICTTFASDKAQFLDPHTGYIVRRKLGTIIFADPIKRQALNHITHPTILRILFHRLFYGIYIRRASICCADIPLLFESTGGYLRYLFGLIVVVATTPDLQYQRLRQRNSDLSPQECYDRIQSQYPMEYKIKAADVVIWNNGSIHELQQQVQHVRQQIQHQLHGGIPVSTLFGGLSSLVIILSLYWQH
jgi:dephospho-CoA kinase